METRESWEAVSDAKTPLPKQPELILGIASPIAITY